MLVLVVQFLVTQREHRDAPHIPTFGLMLKPFGEPLDYQDCGFHTGQDWFAPVGMPVYAVRIGTVVYVGPLWLDGPGVGRGPHAIVIDHGGYHSTYSHLSKALVQAGDFVAQGQQIGAVGAEGFSRGPHLHLEWIDRALAPWTGDWRHPFDGCEGYDDPGGRWRWY